MQRRPRGAIGFALFGLLLSIGFGWLGIWQVERRVWKLDLIARVEARLATMPVPAPGPSNWSRLTRNHDEYARVRVSGRFLASRDTFVSASTVLGPGYWLLTPLRDARGFTVLVNRGYVPARAPIATPTAASVVGLLRLSEPGGDLLRSNAPGKDRWYSRDVAAIGRARRLGAVAPYFIDAAAVKGAPAYPRGGLTVVAFANNHLIYALTWFTLMVLSATATGWVLRRRPD